MISKRGLVIAISDLNAMVGSVNTTSSSAVHCLRTKSAENFALPPQKPNIVRLHCNILKRSQKNIHDDCAAIERAFLHGTSRFVS